VATFGITNGNLCNPWLTGKKNGKGFKIARRRQAAMLRWKDWKGVRRVSKTTGLRKKRERKGKQHREDKASPRASMMKFRSPRLLYMHKRLKGQADASIKDRRGKGGIGRGEISTGDFALSYLTKEYARRKWGKRANKRSKASEAAQALLHLTIPSVARKLNGKYFWKNRKV